MKLLLIFAAIVAVCIGQIYHEHTHPTRRLERNAALEAVSAERVYHEHNNPKIQRIERYIDSVKANKVNNPDLHVYELYKHSLHTDAGLFIATRDSSAPSEATNNPLNRAETVPEEQVILH